MNDLQESLFAAGVLAVVGMLVLLFMYFSRREHRGRFHPSQQSRDDLASMMILLQTMRDLLDQQKQLARQLNANLEKKITYIKETVATARHELDEIRASVSQLSETVDRAKHDHKPENADSQLSLPSAEEWDGRPRGASLTVVPKEGEPKEERPSLHLLAVPKDPPVSEDVIEPWVGFDFGGDDPDPLAFDVPEVPPETPENAEVARDAFRALLNLEQAPPPVPPNTVDKAAEEGALKGGNGRRASPLHAQIYEYNDAGMTVGQIAQELGIGKGEVRLILSLRKDRSL